MAEGAAAGPAKASVEVNTHDAEPKRSLPAWDEAAAIELLEHHVRRWALADADGTWMLAHGALALGPTAPTANGPSVVDALLATMQLMQRDGRRWPSVGGSSGDGTLRDPHPDHTLATLLALGVPRTRAIAVDGATYTLDDAIAGAARSFVPPQGDAWGEAAWSLIVLVEAATLEPALARDAVGTPLDARGLLRASAQALVDAGAFLDAARSSGDAPPPKRKQGVWGQPCGGLHWIDAIAIGVARLDDAAARASLARAVETLAYRVQIEGALYDELRGRAPPQFVVPLWVQELKFFGHVLELAPRLERAGTPLRGAVVSEVRRRLLTAIGALDRLGAFASVDDTRRQTPQLYRDLVGDAAHALAALRPPAPLNQPAAAGARAPRR